MENITTNHLNECAHIECCQNEKHKGWKYCEFHYDGGSLGSGETFEQYSIIEQDFIDFIKIVPIDDENHLKVHSPVLRDIIIRTCVQIELFFKEWAKLECSESPDIDLFKKYSELNKKGEPQGSKNWNIKDYFYFKNSFEYYQEIYVRQLDKKINPFETWTIKTPPFWWNVYNSIKHGGKEARIEANVWNALNALAALFQIHCINRHSRTYLDQFRQTSFSNSFSELKVVFHNLSTPIDTKKFLFREDRFFEKKIELVTKESLKKNTNRYL